MSGTAAFALSEAPIDGDALRARLLDPAAGGFACFEGWVRNSHAGRAVVALDYQAYPALAVREGTRVVEEALARFEILHALCVHRTGALAIGETAVWVGVSAAHRDGAFQACRWILDVVKARVPIWKNEHYRDGGSGWIHPEQ